MNCWRYEHVKCLRLVLGTVEIYKEYQYSAIRQWKIDRSHRGSTSTDLLESHKAPTSHLPLEEESATSSEIIHSFLPYTTSDIIFLDQKLSHHTLCLPLTFFLTSCGNFAETDTIFSTVSTFLEKAILACCSSDVRLLSCFTKYITPTSVALCFALTHEKKPIISRVFV